MKRILSLSLLIIVSFLIAGCSSKPTTQNPNDIYDIIVGDNSKDIVAVTFITVNYAGVNDRYWGVEKGISIGYDREPKYPGRLITIAEYGLSSDFTPGNGDTININTFRFTEDTTVYVKYYGGLLLRRFCIPNGPTDKGSGMMFEQRSFFDNTEVYSLPTLENQYFATDWGNSDLAEDLTPWITQWGYTKIEGWYYDEELTQEVTVPFKITSSDSNIWFWVKGS